MNNSNEKRRVMKTLKEKIERFKRVVTREPIEQVMLCALENALQVIKEQERQLQIAREALGYTQMRLAQVLSGDYKACGLQRQQVLADALKHNKQALREIESITEKDKEDV